MALNNGASLEAIFEALFQVAVAGYPATWDALTLLEQAQGEREATWVHL